MSHPLYTYQRLTEPGTIRLISILPPSVYQGLECTFSEVSLADKPDFVALSYTWGDNAFTETLNCGQGILKITKNLYAALEQFRLPDRPISIWADAICINQSDDEEKSLQIPLMADIYGQATHVLIWLGEASEGSRDVMLYLKRIGQVFLDRGGEILEPRDERSPENDALWKDLIEDPNLEKTGLIWSRPWFSRVWIIQELVLANKATVHCGDVSMDWDILFAACKALGRAATDGSLFWNQTLSRPRSFRATNSLNAWKLEDMKKSMSQGSTVSHETILECLDAARNFHCRDTKDRIFGLSSMFNRGKATPFVIEYTKTEAEVFIEFAQWSLRDSDIVDILSFAGLANHSLISDSLSLPSWVPDWRLPYRSPIDSMGGFTAGHKLTSMVEIDDLSSQISVKGILVDRIVAFVLESDAFKRPDHQPATSVLRPTCLSEWYIQVEFLVNEVMKIQWGGDGEYIGGGSIWEALARTLIIDRNDPFFDYERDRPRATSPDDIASLPHTHFSQFRAYLLNSLASADQQAPGSLPPLTLLSYEFLEYHSRVRAITSNRCFFITSLGYIGLGPKGLKLSDVVCVPAGASVPYVLRPLSPNFKLYWQGVETTRNAYVQLPNGQGYLPYVLRKQEEIYNLVGECYTHGLMRGEVWRTNGTFFEDFRIT